MSLLSNLARTTANIRPLMCLIPEVLKALSCRAGFWESWLCFVWKFLKVVFFLWVNAVKCHWQVSPVSLTNISALQGHRGCYESVSNQPTGSQPAILCWSFVPQCFVVNGFSCNYDRKFWFKKMTDVRMILHATY